MQHKFPQYRSGHALAMAGVIILHTGLAAWAMAPEPLVVIPEQQIIQVSMVAPTVIKQEPVETVEVQQEIPKVPPKEKGMVKIKERHEKKAEQKPEIKEEPKELVQQQSETQLTSGMQADNALMEKSAITKPIAADYLKNPPPEYPSIARKHKQQGTVLLDVEVSKDGSPYLIQIARSSGHAALDEAALKAVERWRFIPARRGSQTVEASVLVPVKFQIN